MLKTPEGPELKLFQEHGWVGGGSQGIIVWGITLPRTAIHLCPIPRISASVLHFLCNKQTSFLMVSFPKLEYLMVSRGGVYSLAYFC